MNIVVLGAGTVGTSIAELLCQRDHSVTVVDDCAEQTKRINNDLDVRAITGSASQSSILFQAGISSADICLAVTGNDEVNIVAASMARAMGARRTIARVYAPVFRDLSTFDYQRHFQVDRMLSLEHLTAMEIARAIRDPNSVLVEQFARGGLNAHDVIVTEDCPPTKAKIKELELPPNVRFGTITRNNKMTIASANDQIQIGDRVTVFSTPEMVKQTRALFHAQSSQHKRVVIAGGGETGLHLARTLEKEGNNVMLLESNEERCQRLATMLESTSVVHCDATRRVHLEEERVGRADVFVACTGDDEDNIMLCVEARDLGAKQIMALISRPDYASVMGKLGIDLAVSEREVMAKQILSYLTRGIEISNTKLPGGRIKVIELEVPDNSGAAETTLAELKLPDGCLIVALIQHDYVRVPSGKDRLQTGDVVILLVEEEVADEAVARFAMQKPAKD
ncbi:MAG: Trk system potassium transporter TrkA [Pirellulaceae bacterium]